MNKSKAKGTAAETAVVNYMISRGYKYCERRALAGALDKGDVGGIPETAIEVKAHKTYSIPAWLREIKIEKANAKASLGFVIIKPNGVGSRNTGEWWVVLPLSEMVDLMQEANR